MNARDWLTFCAIAVIASAVFQLFAPIEIYMDEEFHVPQSQEYCKARFDVWDPMITTFPGLYHFSTIIYNALKIARLPVVCSVEFLRGVNLLLSIPLTLLAIECRRWAIPLTFEDDNWLASLLVYFYPISFFYMFLYYTDTISTVSLLLTYLMAMSRYSLPVGYVKAMRILKTKSYSPKKGDLMRQLSLSDELAPNSRATTPRNSMLSMEGMQKHGDSFDLSLSDNAASLEAWLGHFLLFMFGSMCIFCRQTNAVWLMFFAGTNMIRRLKQHRKLPSERRGGDRLPTIEKLTTFVTEIWNNKIYLLFDNWSLLVPVTLFLVFVYLNGGIVLGDKSNHEPVLHFAMFSHALFLLSVVYWPYVVYDSVLNLIRTVQKVLSALGTACAEFLSWSKSFIMFAIVSFSKKEEKKVTTPRKKKKKRISGSIVDSSSLDDTLKSSRIDMGVDEHGKPETVISTKSFPNELSAIDISEPLIEPEKIYSDEENCSTGMSIMSKAFLHFVLYSLTTYALVYGSYSHPYLLADNRHYAFYIWQRYLQYEDMRWKFSPFYYYAVYHTLKRLYICKGLLWLLVYLIAVGITVIPSPLLEPRYFTPPIVMAILNYSIPNEISQKTRKSIYVLMISSFLLMNAVTIYIFFNKTFVWYNGSIGRFLY